MLVSDAKKMENAYQAYLAKMQELENRKHHDIFFESWEYLINNKIKCFKYNYCLEKDVQNQDNYQAYLKLDEKGQELIIVNLKPKIKQQFVKDTEYEQ